MRITLTALLLALLISSFACEAGNESSQTRDANVATIRARKKVSVAQSDLIGNWKHIAISKTADGKGEALKSVPIVWTFDSDGSGFYKKDSGKSEESDNKSSFKWELKSDELTLTPRGRGSSTTYTIVKNDKTKMVWENNNLGDFYIVEKR